MNRKELLQDYINGYDELTAVFQEADEEVLFYKPSEKQWSIVEIIIHLSDAECNSNVRFRKAIAESGSSVDLYDHDAWALHLDYQHRDMVTALALIKLLRINNYRLLTSLKEEVWSNYVIHPQHGKVTVDDLLRIYAEHLHIHIKQIRRNFESYKNQTQQ